MNIEQLRQLIRETIRDLRESSFSINGEVDRAFNSVGVYPPKMVNVGGSKYEGEIDKGWKLTYDEKSGEAIVGGVHFDSLLTAAEYYKKKTKHGKRKRSTLDEKEFKRFKKLLDDYIRTVQTALGDELHDGLMAQDRGSDDRKLRKQMVDHIIFAAQDAWEADVEGRTNDRDHSFKRAHEFLEDFWENKYKH